MIACVRTLPAEPLFEMVNVPPVISSGPSLVSLTEVSRSPVGAGGAGLAAGVADTGLAAGAGAALAATGAAAGAGAGEGAAGAAAGAGAGAATFSVRSM